MSSRRNVRSTKRPPNFVDETPVDELSFDETSGNPSAYMYYAAFSNISI
jgi:hypothetical protein